MDFMSDCEVGTQELAQEDAAAMATESVEDWPRVSKNSCSDTPQDRGAHVCCRVSVSALVPVPTSASGVFSSGLFLYLKSFKSLESVSLQKSRQGFLSLVSDFQFSVFLDCTSWFPA